MAYYQHIVKQLIKNYIDLYLNNVKIKLEHC